MNDLTTLDFEGSTVRVVEVDSEPYFVGRDVAERLGYANPNKAMNDHCKGVTKRYPLQTSGGIQKVRILSEPDVLRLIVGSKLPAAERFERWVFEEVLPSIRRSGSYAPKVDRQAEALRMVAECRRTFGKAAAQRLWVELGLPAVSGPPATSLPLPVDEIEAFIRQADRPVTRSELYRRVDGRMDARQLDIVMRGLVDSGRVEVVVERTKGRSRITYRPRLAS